MRGKATFRRFGLLGSNLPVYLLLIATLFGCKDKSEQAESEQPKQNIESAEQKEDADTKDVHTTELTLYPAKAPEPAQKYQLLLKAAEQIDADAAPLYEKAIQTQLCLCRRSDPCP
jgi:hypothetical protein